MRTVRDIISELDPVDSYRWLEDDDGAGVNEWQAAQNTKASAYVRDWPWFEKARKSVDRHHVGNIQVPRFVRDRWFRVQDGCVITSTTPFGEGEALIGITSITEIPGAVISWIAPAPNGAFLAVGICEDGSEYNRIEIVHVHDGKLFPNPPPQILRDSWTGGVSWLPDGSGFYFSAFEGTPGVSEQRIFFFEMSESAVTQQDVPLPESGPHTYICATVSDNGRYHIVYQGINVLRPVAMRDAEAENCTWHSLVSDPSSSVFGAAIGRYLFAITTSNASRGRLVKIPLDVHAFADPNAWIELAPETTGVMRSLRIVGRFIYLHELVDTYSRVRIIDMDGAYVGDLPLPQYAAISEGNYPIQSLAPIGHPTKYVFSFSTFAQSCGVYSHNPGEGNIEVLKAPDIVIEDTVVEDCWVNSFDGERIPYHIVRRKDCDTSTAQPTLLYAYGAYNVPWMPCYRGEAAAFVEAGGVFVLAHIRGGGEFGVNWWQDGRMRKKQNGYNDLYAVAEDLIARNCTTKSKLALTGRSNGGLMAGVALTQRPDLWRAVVPQVPVFDLIGGLRDSYCYVAIAGELADPENADDLRTVADYSPYHNIENSIAYPSVWITAGATDMRCPAGESRKFAARLQNETAGTNPILLRIWDHAGHGDATARSTQIDQFTEWLVFVMRELDMRL